MTSPNPVLRQSAAAHQRAAALLSALGSPIRTQLLSALLGGETSTRELARSLGISDAAVSQHLTVLRHHGIVMSHRRGRTVLHTVLDRRAARILRIALDASLDSPGPPF